MNDDGCDDAEPKPTFKEFLASGVRWESLELRPRDLDDNRVAGLLHE